MDFFQKDSTCWSLCSDLPMEKGRYEEVDQRLLLEGEGSHG